MQGDAHYSELSRNDNDYMPVELEAAPAFLVQETMSPGFERSRRTEVGRSCHKCLFAHRSGPMRR